jgi:hypothetical protein
MYDVQDVSGERKTAKWAADWLVKSVTSPEFPLPPADCLMVVLDGGNLSLFDEVVAAFGAISVRVFAHWCCSHTASLLMKALSDVSGIGECIDNARTIVKFIRGHDQPLFLYGEFSSKALVMWVETRFGTNFLVMERIVEVCTQLRQMVADPRWPANRRALTAEGKAAHDKVCAAAAVRCAEAVIYLATANCWRVRVRARAIYYYVFLSALSRRVPLFFGAPTHFFTRGCAQVTELIQSDQFFNMLAKILDLVDPMYSMLRTFDSDKPTVGTAHQLWLETHEACTAWEKTKFDRVHGPRAHGDGKAFEVGGEYTLLSKGSHEYTGRGEEWTVSVLCARALAAAAFVGLGCIFFCTYAFARVCVLFFCVCVCPYFLC